VKSDSTVQLSSNSRLMSAKVVGLLRATTVLVLPIAFGACTWFTDFKRQPSIAPWEPVSQNDADTVHPPRAAPEYSVPVSGIPAASYAISYQRLPVTIDSFSVIPNPVPADQRSIDNGRLQFQINCSACHAYSGNGLGKMVNYGFAIGLTTPSAMGRTDGYIWGMIRNGRGVMPSYNRIEQMERWDIVNYVRALQGKGTIKADTTHAGYAGQNGTTVPRASANAPTRPAPFFKPDITPTPGSMGVNSATYPVVGAEKKPASESKEKPE
jgi:mono/diheme cytochrome c family protein